MWIISYTDPKTQGKIERWLRPGLNYYLGRKREYAEATGIHVKNDFGVEDKKISRRHLSLRLERVPERIAEHPGQRTKIYIKDENSKYGVNVNETNAIEKSKEVPLTKEINKITVGTYHEGDPIIIIEWRNVVFTCSVDGNSPESRQKKFDSIRQKLEPLDIKVLGSIHPQTTCYLREKSHSSKTLLAMVRAIPITGTEYADVVVNSSNKLEADFGSFPDPSKNLFSLEFDVNRGRVKVFEGMVFFTVSLDQYTALLDVVTSARGKLYHCEVSKRSIDIPSTIVSFVKQIIGENSEKKIVILQPDGFFGDSSSKLNEAVLVACQRLGVHMRNATAFYNSIVQCSQEPLLSISAQPPVSTVSSSLQNEGSAPDDNGQNISGLMVQSVVEKPLPKPERHSQRRRRPVLQSTLAKFLDPSNDSVGTAGSTPNSTGGAKRKPREIKQLALFNEEPVEMEMPGLDSYRKRRFNDTSDAELSQSRPSKILRTAAPLSAVTRIVDPIEDPEPENPETSSSSNKTSSRRHKASSSPASLPDLVSDQEDEDQNGHKGEEEEPELDFETLSINEMRRLVTVDEFPIDLHEKSGGSRRAMSASSSSSNPPVPNFKRFKKASLPSKRQPKIEYIDTMDAAGVDHRRLDADAMFNDTEQHKRKAMTASPSPNVRKSKRQKRESNPRQIIFDSDEDNQFYENDQLYEDDNSAYENDNDVVDDDDDIFVPTMPLEPEELEMLSMTESPRLLSKSQSSSNNSRKPSQSRLQSRPANQTRVTQHYDDDSDEDNFKFTT